MKVISKELYSLSGVDKCTKTVIEVDTISSINVLGIDPGTKNFGLAFLTHSKSLEQDFILDITLDRKDNPVERIVYIQTVMKEILKEIDYPIHRVVIEGASFGDKYRQVELAEQRASLALFFVKKVREVYIVPPLKIRKNVFGNGKISGKNQYDGVLLPNGADALVCALYEENRSIPVGTGEQK